MKDYIRQKKISYRNRPVFLVMRLLIDILLLLIDNRMVFILIIVFGALSVSTKYNMEEEYLLPMTYDEIKRRRLTEVKAIMLRSFILGVGNTVISYFLPALRFGAEFLSGRPFVCLAMFVFSMVALWTCLIDSLVFKKRNKSRGFGASLIEFIPVYVVGMYCWKIIDRSESSFFYEGPEWVHILILMIIAVVLVIYDVSILRKWQFHDYVPALQDVRNTRK